MSAFLQEELWVVVNQAERPNAPRPLPLESGFSLDTKYRVMGLHCPSETSEAYFILCNDRDEVWFISNQHFRVADGEQYRQQLSVTLKNGHAKTSKIDMSDLPFANLH